nr:gliding motility-associated C-terminal domain-containing protein [Bacteroidota bacterium]
SEDRVNLAPGNYHVTITDTEASSCDTIANFVVVPEVCKKLDTILIPNVITPNGDVHNQYFYIKGLEGFPGSLLEIYDRWGLKMYETSNYLNDWDGGNYKTGKPVPDGVYYYMLYLSDKEKTIYHGFVQVLKQNS